LTTAQSQTKMLTNLARDFLLQFDNVGKLSPALTAPKLGMGFEIDKLCLNIDALVEEDDSPTDQCPDVELASVFCEIGRVPEAECSLARNHPQLLHGGKRVDKALRDALAEVFDLWVASRILERQDRERINLSEVSNL